MKDEAKTKKQLISEIIALRQRVADLETLQTDSKPTEEVFEKSEREYRNLVDNALVGIYKTNLKGDVLYANEALAKIYEFETPEEFISAGAVARYKHLEDRTAFIEKLEQTGRIESMELELVTQKGVTRQVLVSAVLDGEVLEGMVMDITAYKRVENTLRESEEKFRNLAEESPNMIFINQGGSVVYVNEVSEQLMGYSREEFLSPDFDFMRLIAQESIETVQENFRRHMRGQEVLPYEYQLLTKEGKRLDGIHTTRLITYEGQPAILGIVTDITARKQAEAALRESEERYRFLYENTPSMLHSIDRDGRLVSVSNYWLEVFGYERDEVIGRQITEFLTEAFRHYAEEVILPEVFRTGFAKDVPYQFVKRNGEVMDIRLSAIAERDAEGEVSRTLAVLNDVTERKQMEQKLQESEKRYRALYEEAPIAYYGVSTDGCIRSANPYTAEMSGYALADLIGRSVFDLYADTPAGKEKAEQVLQRFRAGEEIRGEELEWRTADGRSVWISLTVRPSWDAAGQVVESRAMAVDITERKQVERALQEEKVLMDALMENSLDSIYFKDEQCRLTRVSRKMLNDLELTDMSQVLGKTDMELFGREFGRQTLADDRKIIATGKPIVGLVESRPLENGETNWTMTTKVPLRNAGGRITGLVGITREINELKHTMDELRKFSRAVEQSASAIVIANHQGIIEYVNPAFAQITGYTSEEATGSNLEILKSGDLPLEFYEEAWATITKGEVWQGEIYSKKKNDNKLYWEMVVISPVRNEKNDITHYVAIIDDITQRKQVEQTLAEERNLLRTLIDNLPDYIYVLDTESRFVISNIAVAQLMGVANPDELIGKTDFDFYPQELAAQYRTDDQEVFRSGKPRLNQEEAVISPSGSTNWVLTTRVPLRDSQGKITGLVGISHDITERKQVEQALQESEERYRHLVELSPDGIAIHQDGKAVFVNNAGARLLGAANPEALLGWSVLDFVHPDSQESVKQRLQKMLGEEGAVVPLFQEKFIRVDGTFIDVEVTASSFIYQGKPAIQVVFHDITQRKRMDDALRQSEERLRAFANALPDLAFILDEDGRHVEVLTGREGLLSVSADQMKGRLLHEVLPKREADELLAMVQHTIETGQPQTLEYALDVAAGQRWFEGRTSPLREISGEDSMVVLISRDVTEHKRAENAAREAKQRYRNLFEEAPVMTVISRRQGGGPIITDCNQLFLNTLGFTRAEVVGRPLVDFYTPESRAKLIEGGGYNRTLEGRFIVEERELLTSDGQVVETLLYAFPETDGEVIGTRAMYVDIRERKRADAELKQRATQLALINDIGSRIAAVLELDSLLERAARLVQESFDYHHVALFMIDGVVIRLKAVASLYKPIPASHTQRLSQGINGWVATHGEKIVANDVSAEPRFTFLLGEHSTTRSELCLPIKVMDQTVGILDIQSPYLNTFDENDIVAMETLTGQIAVAIENARLHTETERRVQQLAVMHELDRAISASLNIDEVYRAFSEYMELLLFYDRMSIVLLEADKLIITYVAGIAEPGVGTRLPLKDTTSERVLTRGKPLLIHDVTVHMYSASEAEWATGVKSVMVLPLQAKGQAIGTWNIGSRQVGFYQVDDLHIAQMIADQLAIGIENARLYEQAQQEIVERKRRTLELSTMLETAKAVSSTLDLDKMLTLIARQMMKAIGAAGCTLSRWDEEHNTLITWIELRREGSEYAEKPGTTYALDDYPTTRTVLETLQPKTVVATEPNADRAEAALMQQQGTLSLLMLPLSIGERAIGLVELDDEHERVFSPADIRLGQALADQCAVAVENARLYRQAQQEIAQRTQAEAALEEERATLAQRVEERTAELSVANAELARAARLKDEFLANMSHELRTPLNAVLGMSEVLRNEVYGPLTMEQMGALGHIEEGGRHLLELINDILDLSKIEAGKFDLNIGPVWVDDVCQASLLFIKQMAQKKRIKVSSTFDNAVETLQADQRRLKQILVNLLSNAVKFTPDEGQVGLEVEGDATRPAVHFTVWDTGIGIAPEAMDRLFKPFVQIDSRLSRQYEGTGLGLSLVRRLAEMHGGGVSVESEVGQGSRFTVSLPWTATDDQPPLIEASPETAPPATAGQSTVVGGPRLAVILLVEDNETNIITIRDYLQNKGYQVIVAYNGVEAIERARNTQPDIILMDIQMPVMDGLEATRRLRADATPEVALIPIIALTSLAMPGDRERCLAAGANEYLSKPVSLAGLVQVIEAQLHRVK